MPIFDSAIFSAGGLFDALVPVVGPPLPGPGQGARLNRDPALFGQSMAIHVDTGNFSVVPTPKPPQKAVATYQGSGPAIRTHADAPPQWQDDTIHGPFFPVPTYWGRSQAIHVFGQVDTLPTIGPISSCDCPQDAGCPSRTETFAVDTSPGWGPSVFGNNWVDFYPGGGPVFSIHGGVGSFASRSFCSGGFPVDGYVPQVAGDNDNYVTTAVNPVCGGDWELRARFRMPAPTMIPSIPGIYYPHDPDVYFFSDANVVVDMNNGRTIVGKVYQNSLVQLGDPATGPGTNLGGTGIQSWLTTPLRRPINQSVVFGNLLGVDADIRLRILGGVFWARTILSGPAGYLDSGWQTDSAAVGLTNTGIHHITISGEAYGGGEREVPPPNQIYTENVFDGRPIYLLSLSLLCGPGCTGSSFDAIDCEPCQDHACTDVDHFNDREVPVAVGQLWGYTTGNKGPWSRAVPATGGRVGVVASLGGVMEYDSVTFGGPAAPDQQLNYAAGTAKQYLIRFKMAGLGTDSAFTNMYITMSNAYQVRLAVADGTVLVPSGPGTYIKLTDGNYTLVGAAMDPTAEYYLRWAWNSITQKAYAKLWKVADPEPDDWMISETTASVAVGAVATYLRINWGGATGAYTAGINKRLSIRSIEECTETAIPNFTPGFMPTFRRQIGDPTTSLDSFICTMESGAMVLDWQTRGAVKVWGGELIPYSGRTEASIRASGTNLSDVQQAWRHWGQHLDIRSGHSWSDLLQCLAEGRAIILQGDHGVFTLAERCQDSFEGNHAISVYPYQQDGYLLRGDPLCSKFNSIKLTSLKAYAEALGVAVYGVTSPQRILFAVSRPWVP